jgi:hypothetical protein
MMGFNHNTVHINDGIDRRRRFCHSACNAKDMTIREIVATIKEMYDADVSPMLISKVTDAFK